MVNVEDIKVSEEDLLNPQCRLDVIYYKQHLLLEKYHPIEQKSGLRLCLDVPVDLHSPRGQSTLKDYAWRFTEELGEALEAFNLHRNNPTHCMEELSDALHFLVEFSIHAGFSPKQVRYMGLEDGIDFWDFMFFKAQEVLDHELDEGDFPIMDMDYPSLLLRTGATVEAMAKACNTLKNKPWKQSHMLTDIDRFRSLLWNTWIQFLALCIVAGMDADSLYRIYLDKNAVNQFRQRSNY